VSSQQTIVVAPDKFKGSLTASQAARAIAAGASRAAPSAECTLCPMADGGEGTVDTFVERGARRISAQVDGPRGNAVASAFALQDDTAILEMSSASGLQLLEKDERDPTRTNTFGTGELLLAALNAGARRLIVGIGGSATNDVGTGMLRALGARFLDEHEREIDGDILDFERLATIDVRGLDRRLQSTTIEVACDVDNPLCGPNGATRTFAPQKGATPAQIELLESVVRHVACVAAATLGRDRSDVPGAGAAGGLGFAFDAFLGARLERGVEIVARACGLDGLLANASLCLTGEGKIDLQTLHGKTVDGVARLAAKHGVHTIAFGGRVDGDAAAALKERGIDVVPIAPAGTSAEESMRRAAELLERAAETAVRSLR
jgi:glycerate 2-kinase